MSTYDFPVEVGVFGVAEPAEAGVEVAVAAAGGAGQEADVVHRHEAAVPAGLEGIMGGRETREALGDIPLIVYSIRKYRAGSGILCPHFARPQKIILCPSSLLRGYSCTSPSGYMAT